MIAEHWKALEAQRQADAGLRKRLGIWALGGAAFGGFAVFSLFQQQLLPLVKAAPWLGWVALTGYVFLWAYYVFSE